jgi:Mg-chelatase subunit ChlD
MAAPGTQMRASIPAGSRSLGLRTWAISVGIHAAVLLPLTLFRPGAVLAVTAQPATPTAKVEAVHNALKENTPLPKPKVLSAASASTASASPIAPEVSRDLTRLPAENETLRPIVRESQAPSRQNVAGRPRYVAPEVEFFGSSLSERKVCFVVDASGSMLPFFPTVRSHLAASIQGLQPDQYFGVILFNNKLYECTPATLTRASNSAKTSAVSFVSNVQAAGPTSPLAAIERAMKCRDASGDAPGVIYFLTDGFDMAPGATDDLPSAVEALRKKLAPATKITTIGFMTQPRDSLALQKMAKASGGTYVSVTE